MNDGSDVVTPVDGSGDAAKLARTVSRLSDIARHHALRLAYDVGRIVKEDLFDGDIEAFAKRSEAPWMRALAEHPDLPFSAVLLSRSCSVYELMERLGVGVDDTPLTLSHFRAVLALGSKAPSLQQDLLSQAQAGRWTAEQLAARVAESDQPRHHRGRRPQHAARKAVAALGRLVEGKLGSLTSAQDGLAGLDPAEVPELLDVITGAEHELSVLRARLESLGPAATS